MGGEYAVPFHDLLSGEVKSMVIEGLDLVKNAPELFEAYHAGFRAQVESWPTKPVDVVAALLKRSPKSWIVADFGRASGLQR